MKPHIYSLLASTLLLAQTLWLSATPALAAAPRHENNELLAPIVVDSCPGFSAFDAAAILQEEVQSSTGISNLLFGPVDEGILAQGSEGDKKGFCGYVSMTSPTATSPTATSTATDTVDMSQTHLLTSIDAGHAVVAQHLSLASDTVLFAPGWFDLDTLVEVVGAANPNYDRAASQAMLLVADDYPPYPEVLYAVSYGAPSFKAEWLEVEADQPYEEVLWLWQTLDDGYFSLLMARTGLEYWLVAARLGPDVHEQHVQGYSRVILDQVAAGYVAEQKATSGETTENAAKQESTTAETAGVTAESESVALACALLSDDDAAILVGETTRTFPVDEEGFGVGCKYLPASKTYESDPADLSARFKNSGALVVVVPHEDALRFYKDMPMFLEMEGVAEGVTEREIASVQAAADDGDLSAILKALAQLDLQTETVQIAGLPAVSEDALLLRFIDNRQRSSIFVRGLPDGTVLQIVVIRTDLTEMEASEVEEIEAAIDEVVVRALTAFAQNAGKLPIATVSKTAIISETGRVSVAERATTTVASSIAGVEVYPDLPRTHAEPPITYDPIPPVGGEHSSDWINCGVYTVTLPNEMAVHSLEHGAVWITYQPDLPAKQVAILQALTKAGEYRLLSPYPGLPSPVVASAWGYQLKLDSADDPRLVAFVTTYENHPDGPEVGAPCDQGVDYVAEQETIAGGTAEEAAEQETTTVETAGETADPEPATFDCSLLSDEDAALLLGEATRAYEVANERGAGCKYIPESTNETIESDDFNPNFPGSSVLVGVMSNEDGLWLLGDLPSLLEEAGAEANDIDDLQAAVDDGDLVGALETLATFNLQTEMVRIEALPEVSEDAVWLRVNFEGEVISFFMRSLADETLLQLTVKRADISEAHANKVKKIEAALREVAVRVLSVE